jgi:hypothetical protein
MRKSGARDAARHGCPAWLPGMAARHAIYAWLVHL